MTRGHGLLSRTARAFTRLDSIVTVVDAKHILAQLDDSHEAVEQIAFADTILLNKIDLLSPEELDAVEARLRVFSRFARLHRTRNCAVPLTKVLDRRAFDLDRILEIDPGFLGEDDHGHDAAIASVSLVEERQLDFERVNLWLMRLLRDRGPDILSCKGILSIAGEDEQFSFKAST